MISLRDDIMINLCDDTEIVGTGCFSFFENIKVFKETTIDYQYFMKNLSFNFYL